MPFLYSTNGEVIWFHDVRHELNRSRDVSGFHTPDALREMLARDFDAELAKLARDPAATRACGPTRSRRTQAIEQAIADAQAQDARRDGDRHGQDAHDGQRDLPADEVRRRARVLFLVDRRALAAQAVRAFASFEAEPGLKFDKIYEVYCQRFQQGDFGEDEKFDPNVMPNILLTEPEARRRLRLRLARSSG